MIFKRDLTFRGRLFVESNIDQKKSNYEQGISNTSLKNKIIKIKHSYFPRFLSTNAPDNGSIVNPIGNVNNIIFERAALLEENGIAKAARNHPAARLTNNSEIRLYRIGSINIRNILS